MELLQTLCYAYLTGNTISSVSNTKLHGLEKMNIMLLVTDLLGVK